MSSVKSLLAAKKQAARLTAPHARYSGSGALSCSLCSLPIKSEALWGSHIVSKAHRNKLRTWEAEQASLKRAREEDEDDEGEREGKRTKELPADFFSNPDEAPAPQERTPEPDEEEDPEWAAFEASLAQEDAPVPSTAAATLSAAPVEYEFGAPKVAEEGEEEEQEEEEEEEVGETEEERREREEREEREDILQRIEEEEREQKEADEKVNALKRRLEAIRAAKKAKA